MSFGISFAPPVNVFLRAILPAPLIKPAAMANALPVACKRQRPRCQASTTGWSRGRIPALYITGPIVLGSMWLLTIGLTAALTDPNDPNAGRNIGTRVRPRPWTLDRSHLQRKRAMGSATRPLGLAQATGLGLTIAGIAVRREVKVTVYGRTDVPHRSHGRWGCDERHFLRGEGG